MTQVMHQAFDTWSMHYKDIKRFKSGTAKIALRMMNHIISLVLVTQETKETKHHGAVMQRIVLQMRNTVVSGALHHWITRVQ